MQIKIEGVGLNLGINLKPETLHLNNRGVVRLFTSRDGPDSVSLIFFIGVLNIAIRILSFFHCIFIKTKIIFLGICCFLIPKV